MEGIQSKTLFLAFDEKIHNTTLKQIAFKLLCFKFLYTKGFTLDGKFIHKSFVPVHLSSS